MFAGFGSDSVQSNRLAGDNCPDFLYEESSTPVSSHIIGRLAAGSDGRSRQRGRKVRTPQSGVPDNVREAGLKPGRRKVPQKIYRPGGNIQVRVKRCGKSAPPPQ